MKNKYNDHLVTTLEKLVREKKYKNLKEALDYFHYKPETCLPIDSVCAKVGKVWYYVQDLEELLFMFLDPVGFEHWISEEDSCFLE